MFKKLHRATAASRLLEERLYEQVVSELSNGQRRDGLWAKALADSDGKEEKAKALYIQYRVRSIKDEYELTRATANHTAQSEGESSDRVEARVPEKTPIRWGNIFSWVISLIIGLFLLIALFSRSLVEFSSGFLGDPPNNLSREAHFMALGLLINLLPAVVGMLCWGSKSVFRSWPFGKMLPLSSPLARVWMWISIAQWGLMSVLYLTLIP